MLDHEALRDELIRQLEAGEIKAVAVANGLGIAEPRIVELRKRKRRVQQHEMEPLARLLGLVAEQPVTIMMPVALPSAKALTSLFEGLLEAADRPDLVDELAPMLAQRFPAALRRTLEHPEGQSGGQSAPASATQEPGPKDRPVRQ